MAVGPDRALGRGAVITPHGGEFERMTDRPPTYAEARDLAVHIGAAVLLKGNPTFVTDGGIPCIVFYNDVPYLRHRLREMGVNVAE